MKVRGKAVACFASTLEGRSKLLRMAITLSKKCTKLSTPLLEEQRERFLFYVVGLQNFQIIKLIFHLEVWLCWLLHKSFAAQVILDVDIVVWIGSFVMENSREGGGRSSTHVVVVPVLLQGKGCETVYGQPWEIIGSAFFLTYIATLWGYYKSWKMFIMLPIALSNVRKENLHIFELYSCNTSLLPIAALEDSFPI